MTDPYNVLGVGKGATADEIKSQYRKLASIHHPDKEGGSTTKFQELQDAYDTLKDPEKRARYDNPFGGRPSNPFAHHQHFDFNFTPGQSPDDILAQMFGQGFRRPPPPPRRNKDLRITVSVSLESTLVAQSKDVSIRTTKGDKFDINITIPQGVTTGSTIKFANYGDNFFETLPRGDLFVVVSVTGGERFQIVGNDLVTNLEITAIDALVGVEREVEGLGGTKFKLKIPPGSQYETKFKIPNQGICGIDSPRGDLFVNLIIYVPKLDDANIQALKEIFKYE